MLRRMTLLATLLVGLALGWIAAASEFSSPALAEEEELGAVTEYAGKVVPPAVRSISARMRRYVSAKEVAGVVTLVATHNSFLHLDATGQAALNPAEPMQTDSIFWIASMSK